MFFSQTFLPDRQGDAAEDEEKDPSGLWRAAPAAPQELLLRSFLHRDFYRTCVPDELHELRKLQHNLRTQAKTADVKASLNHSWEGITVQEESEPLQVLPSLCQGLHKQESSPPHPGIL